MMTSYAGTLYSAPPPLQIARTPMLVVVVIFIIFVIFVVVSFVVDTDILEYSLSSQLYFPISCIMVL